MKSYLSFFKLNLLTNLQYRMEAIAGIATQIFFGLISCMVYLAFFNSNNGTSTPMNLQEIITYVWLAQSFFTLIYPYTKDMELLNMIKNGNLSYELIRPQNVYFKYFIKMFSKRLSFVTLRSFPLIIFAFLLPKPLKLTLPASLLNLIIFFFALIIGGMLISALNTLIHMVTIYLIDQKGTINIYSVIADLFMGTIIPLPFLPKFLYNLSKILPFRYISDFPFRIYSNSITLSEGKILIIGSIIWLTIILTLGNIITNKILKRAVIQGG